MVWDIAWFKDRSQKCIDYTEKLELFSEENYMYVPQPYKSPKGWVFHKQVTVYVQ